MGERLDAYNAKLNFDKQQNEAYLSEQEAAEKEMKDTAKSIQDIKDKVKATKEAYSRFSNNVRIMLLSEAIYDIYSACLPEKDTRNIVAENLVKNYVKEKGVGCIFESMGKTYANEIIQNLVNTYHKSILEKADKEDPETFKVEMSDKIAFLDDLNKESDIENVKQAIALRVSNAEEEFINNNLADKYDLDTIIDDTKQRIENTQQDRTMDDETKNAINQEATNLSKQRINAVREERTRNVYEHMMRLISESVVTTKEESLKEQYFTESGKINIDKVNESVRAMYGFLETLNTCRIEKIDESYIEEMFRTMK